MNARPFRSSSNPLPAKPPKMPHKPPANCPPRRKPAKPERQQFVEAINSLYAQWLAAGPPWVR